MKKQLLAAAALLCGFASFAQTPWTTYNAMTDTVFGVRYFDAVDTNIAWGVFSNGVKTKQNVVKIFNTTNGGQNFTYGNVFADTNDYHITNISALNATTAFVGGWANAPLTMHGQVLKTTDGGQTWTNIADANMFTGGLNFPDVVHFWDVNNGIVIGDVNGSVAGGTAANEYEIYTTTNGGANWTRVADAALPAPQTSEGGRTNVYGTFGDSSIWFGTNKGRVFRSFNRGQSWAVSSASIAAGVNGITFSSKTNGLAWGHSASPVTATNTVIKKTTNGGQTWLSVPLSANIGTYDIFNIPGLTDAYMSVGVNGTNTGVVTSVTFDAGVTWTVLENGTTNDMLKTQVEMIDASHGFAGGFSDNTVGAPVGGFFRYTGTSITLSMAPLAAQHVLSHVYPNPSTGLVNIETKVKGSATVTVVDVLGKTVFTQALTHSYNNNTLSFDFSALPKGVYVMNIASQGEVSAVRFVVE